MPKYRFCHFDTRGHWHDAAEDAISEAVDGGFATHRIAAFNPKAHRVKHPRKPVVYWLVGAGLQRLTDAGMIEDISSITTFQRDILQIGDGRA